LTTLLVFEGQSGMLLASRLRPGNAMGSREAVSSGLRRVCGAEA
jgi:hypothetical protein